MRAGTTKRRPSADRGLTLAERLRLQHEYAAWRASCRREERAANLDEARAADQRREAAQRAWYAAFLQGRIPAMVAMEVSAE